MALAVRRAVCGISESVGILCINLHVNISQSFHGVASLSLQVFSELQQTMMDTRVPRTGPPPGPTGPSRQSPLCSHGDCVDAFRKRRTSCHKSELSAQSTGCSLTSLFTTSPYIMDMSDSSSDSNSTSTMMMVPYLHFAGGDPLFFSSITPTSSGAIAGASTVLVILALIDRLLFAIRGSMEDNWRSR